MSWCPTRRWRCCHRRGVHNNGDIVVDAVASAFADGFGVCLCLRAREFSRTSPSLRSGSWRTGSVLQWHGRCYPVGFLDVQAAAYASSTGSSVRDRLLATARGVRQFAGGGRRPRSPVWSIKARSMSPRPPAPLRSTATPRGRLRWQASLQFAIATGIDGTSAHAVVINDGTVSAANWSVRGRHFSGGQCINATGIGQLAVAGSTARCAG